MISSDWLEAVDFSMRSCLIFGRSLYCQHFVKSLFKDKDKGKTFLGFARNVFSVTRQVALFCSLHVKKKERKTESGGETIVKNLFIT